MGRDRIGAVMRASCANPGGRLTYLAPRPNLDVITPPWAAPTSAFLVEHIDEK